MKLYSKDARIAWEQLNADEPALPKGFSWTEELEGVDGKSGLVGSGRTVPIDVTDSAYPIKYVVTSSILWSGDFTSEHLAKFEGLHRISDTAKCSICREAISLTETVSMFNQ